MPELASGPGDRGYPYESPHIEMEIYRLIACVSASRSFSEGLSDASDGPRWMYLKRAEFGEICRILVSVAAILRNTLDAGYSGEEATRPVGLIHSDIDNMKEPETLVFRQACNKILHAFKVHADVEDPSQGIKSPLTSLIHLYGEQNGKTWHAIIDIKSFALTAVYAC